MLKLFIVKCVEKNKKKIYSQAPTKLRKFFNEFALHKRTHTHEFNFFTISFTENHVFLATSIETKYPKNNHHTITIPIVHFGTASHVRAKREKKYIDSKLEAKES